MDISSMETKFKVEQNECPSLGLVADKSSNWSYFSIEIGQWIYLHK